MLYPRSVSFDQPVNTPKFVLKPIGLFQLISGLLHSDSSGYFLIVSSGVSILVSPFSVKIEYP